MDDNWFRLKDGVQTAFLYWFDPLFSNIKVLSAFKSEFYKKNIDDIASMSYNYFN